MGDWNFDISQAPRGTTVVDYVQTANGVRKTTRFLPVKIILATKCGKVTISRYMSPEARWEMLQKGEIPLAWQIWPVHPDFEAAHSPSPLNPPADEEGAAANPGEAQS